MASSSKNYRDKEWMYQKYIVESLTLSQIGEIAGVDKATIWKNLKRLGIPLRKPGKYMESSRLAKIGQKRTLETRQLMSLQRKGSGNGNWKGGLTIGQRHFRKSRQYQEWRQAVLSRDNHKCQYNGCEVITNIAHHIKPIKTNPELKLDINNGMAICHPHHVKIHRELKL